ncbi:longitudinals lacking protein, isoforms J/P/Q/S/Z-like [Macrobrachium nipponense]|uniref:longitudinals lacking protein, isoforms J/P/Q/S/Z-like n=1 Tax=Macrobrachium nipponense TaxID=159736 RepID=UPI0030C7F36E
MEVARVKLKWNNHQCIFSHYLQEYLYCNQPRFSDAMIACEGRIFMVHRIILSTCSHFFDEIFQKTPNDNARPVIILNDASVEAVEWLLSYMYCGEVTIPKDSLPLLFKLAEQLKIKGLSQLEIPDFEKRLPVPGNVEGQGDGTANKNVAKSHKRKLSEGNNVQTKKSTSSVSVGQQSDSPSFVLTPPLQTVAASATNMSFPQNGSPVIVTSTVPGSLSSSSIIIKPPTATPLASSMGTRIIPPPNVVRPETMSSSSLPIVTIPVSALPAGVQTSVSSGSPMLQTSVSSGSQMPILTNCLLGKSTVIPSSVPSSTAVTSSGSSTIIVTSSTRHNGSIITENSAFNFLPVGTTTDHPLLTEIKEEVKEEPLTLGPDDPLSMDNVDDYDDDDFSNWSVDDTPVLPEAMSSASNSTSTNAHMLVLPRVVSSLSMAEVLSSKKKLKSNDTASETVREQAGGGEGEGSSCGEEGGSVSRSQHVLPQIVPPFMAMKTHVKAKSKDNKSKVQQSQGHIQGDKQPPASDVEGPVKMYTSDVVDVKKAYLPQKTPEKTDMPCRIKVVTKSVKKDEYTPSKEVVDGNVQSEKRQPEPCNVTITMPPARSVNEPQNQYSNFEDDAGLREMMEFIQEESDNSPVFVPIESEKKRNQPYLIRSTKIATKNDEPVKFCLRGAKANQIVTICMRYTEEKYKHIPVNPCRLHQKDNGNSNFLISSIGGSPVMYRNDEDGHPTAHMVIGHVDMVEMSNFIFFVTFICLNSCHKNNGKKMELVCKLLDPTTSQVVSQSNFEVRVCKNVKRDYKEVIQGGDSQCLKVLVRPDAYLYPEEVVLTDGKSAGKSHGLASGSGSIQALEDKVPIAEALTLAKKQDNQNHDLYLIRLPNSKRGKLVLDLVREFEKTMLDLENSPASQDTVGNDQESL